MMLIVQGLRNVAVMVVDMCVLKQNLVRNMQNSACLGVYNAHHSESTKGCSNACGMPFTAAVHIKCCDVILSSTTREYSSSWASSVYTSQDFCECEIIEKYFQF